MGLSVAGLAVFGLVVVFLVFRHLFDPGNLQPSPAVA